MTNLAAAKDVTAFTVLENPSSPTYPVNKESAMDDESVARRMAEQYEEMGIDPNFAFNRDDPLEDFGGTRNIT